MPSVLTRKSIALAKHLRANTNKGERLFWSKLKRFRKDHGVHVRRQVPIGPYVVDFAVHDRKLVIELDGESHATIRGRKRDAMKDRWLASKGYRVLRIMTGDLSRNFEDCISSVLNELDLLK